MFKEPLSVFTDIAAFGETVLIDGVAVAAIFDREAALDSGFGLAVSNADPQLIVADADLPEQMDTIVARNVAYQVVSVDFDGTGMSVIQLKRKETENETPTY